MGRLQQQAAAIRLAAFDVDGVLTDGSLTLGDDGSETKTFHVHDGFGLVLLLEHGMQVAIISARHSPAVTQRMLALGVQHVRQGVTDKRAALLELLAACSLAPEQCCFVGDDLPDLPAMNVAGLGIAVADAHPRVRDGADWVTAKPGGRGAVREVCEFLLDAQGVFESICKRYIEASVGKK